MLAKPLNPMVLLIIIPFLNGYFIGNINPTFSDKPILDLIRIAGNHWANWAIKNPEKIRSDDLTLKVVVPPQAFQDFEHMRNGKRLSQGCTKLPTSRHVSSVYMIIYLILSDYYHLGVLSSAGAKLLSIAELFQHLIDAWVWESKSRASRKAPRWESQTSSKPCIKQSRTEGGDTSRSLPQGQAMKEASEHVTVKNITYHCAVVNISCRNEHTTKSSTHTHTH